MTATYVGTQLTTMPLLLTSRCALLGCMLGLMLACAAIASPVPACTASCGAKGNYCGGVCCWPYNMCGGDPRIDCICDGYADAQLPVRRLQVAGNATTDFSWSASTIVPAHDIVAGDWIMWNGKPERVSQPWVMPPAAPTFPAVLQASVIFTDKRANNSSPGAIWLDYPSMNTRLDFDLVLSNGTNSMMTQVQHVAQLREWVTQKLAGKTTCSIVRLSSTSDGLFFGLQPGEPLPGHFVRFANVAGTEVAQWRLDDDSATLVSVSRTDPSTFIAINTDELSFVFVHWLPRTSIPSNVFDVPVACV